MRRTARALSAAVLTGAALGGPTAAVGAVPAVDLTMEQALHQGVDQAGDRAMNLAVGRAEAMGQVADPVPDPAPDPGAHPPGDPATDQGAGAKAPRSAAPDPGGYPPGEPPVNPPGNPVSDPGGQPPVNPSADPPPHQGADPSAEVSPATVHPGGSVTVSVSCDPDKGPAPKTVEATSDAFVDGVAELRRLPGADHAGGPAYRGAARIAPAAELDAGAGPGSAWTVDGTCPARAGTEGKPWSATFTVKPGGGTPTAPPDGHHPCPQPHTESCGDAEIPGGVRAGKGGAFTDSVPALTAGGVCITAALGGAVYRLRRKRPDTEGREGRGAGPVD